MQQVTYVVCFALLIGLGIYALHKKTGWLRIHGSVLRVITFSMEIGQSDGPKKPRDDRKELEPGGDDLRPCWPHGAGL